MAFKVKLLKFSSTKLPSGLYSELLKANAKKNTRWTMNNAGFRANSSRTMCLVLWTSENRATFNSFSHFFLDHSIFFRKKYEIKKAFLRQSTRNVSSLNWIFASVVAGRFFHLGKNYNSLRSPSHQKGTRHADLLILNNYVSWSNDRQLHTRGLPF